MLNKTFWAFIAALLVAGASSAEEKVKLEYKLKAGTELIYNAVGTVKAMVGQDAVKMEADRSGPERFVVVEADAKTGEMLIGQAPDIKMVTKTNTPAGVQQNESRLNDASVFRMDRAGNVAAREPKGGGQARPPVPRLLAQIDRQDLIGAALPAGAVAVGDKWESATNSAFFSFPLAAPAKVASTLAEIKVVDGRKCAVIKSKLTAGDKPAAAGMPDLAVTGEVETLFDIEGGFARSVAGKLEVAQGGAAETYAIETTALLDSVKPLPEEDAKFETKLFRGLDAALTGIFDGDFDKAGDALDGLKEGDLTDAQKAQIDKITARTKLILRFARRPPPRFNPRVPQPSGVNPAPAPAAEDLFSDAQKAMQEQNWADAVAKFKDLADKFPNHALTPEALNTAAAICENRLNDTKSADDLRKRAAALKH